MFKYRPRLTHTDKLCLVAMAGIIITGCLFDWATRGPAAYIDTYNDGPQVEAVAVAPSIDCTPLVEAVEAARDSAKTGTYDEAIPLNCELQEVLREACDEHGVPLCLVLGLIEVESNFDPYADSGVSAGLMQLNTRYYPSDLTPEENIRAGVAHLAGQIERYGGDIQAALRAYNRGFDDGDRQYSTAVLNSSEKWGCG